MRIWVDLTNTAHVLVLRPLVELLEADGHEVEITARPLSHTLELLDDWGHDYTALGAYGGVSRVGEARAAGGRGGEMPRLGRGGGIEAALVHRSSRLPMAWRGPPLPNSP